MTFPGERKPHPCQVPTHFSEVWFFKFWWFNFFSKVNFVHSAWMECLFKLLLLTTCLMDAIHASECPPIWIKSRPEEGGCYPECHQGYYCHNRRCNTCSACRDPYIMAEQGETELFIYAECINKGSCPDSCTTSSWPNSPKGNTTLCQCVDVVPPPPTVPPTIACKVGCKHGGCVETGECDCDDGWSGALCDECVLDPGCQHGHCNETERCICNQDWDGINCDQDVSYCFMNQPCLNKGRCENDGNGGYTCTCSEGFTGSVCENETSLHRCERVCPSNGSCIKTESAGIYQCHCQEGYTGADCTQPITRTSGNQFSLHISVFVLSVFILIVAVICIVIFCRKCRFNNKSEGIPGSSSNSGMPLIIGELVYRLEGTTVYLTIKPSWKPCFLKTCKCLMETPYKISENSEMEVSVPNLREGFRYSFEIKRTPTDVEDGDCNVAECEVLVEFSASGDGESNCAETIKNALFDVATKRALNRPLEVDRRLRERVADFFEISADHRKSFLGGQTPEYLYIDILQEILESYEVLNKEIGELLSYLAEESCGQTEDFVEILIKFHPTCQSCAQLWHKIHGGTTVFTHAACNGITIHV